MKNLISTEEVLNTSMGSSLEAGMAEFYELWNSSESLRLRITQELTNESSDRETEKVDSLRTQEEATISRAKRSFSQNDIIKTFIDAGIVNAQSVDTHTKVTHGGLTRTNLLLLLERYKAGNKDLGVYFLVREWKKHSSNLHQTPDIRLKRLTLAYFERAVTRNRADFFEEIADTLKFLQEEEYHESGKWKHDPAQWWQFNLLLFIFENPQENYAIREFIAYFEQEVGTNEMPTSKTLRSFCRSHGIALNSKPGAPKKVK